MDATSPALLVRGVERDSTTMADGSSTKQRQPPRWLEKSDAFWIQCLGPHCTQAPVFKNFEASLAAAVKLVDRDNVSLFEALLRSGGTVKDKSIRTLANSKVEQCKAVGRGKAITGYFTVQKSKHSKPEQGSGAASSSSSSSLQVQELEEDADADDDDDGDETLTITQCKGFAATVAEEDRSDDEADVEAEVVTDDEGNAAAVKDESLSTPSKKARMSSQSSEETDDEYDDEEVRLTK